MFVDSINIDIKTFLTSVKYQIARFYNSQQELKLRRFGQNDRLDQVAVHIDFEADLMGHRLNVKGNSFRSKDYCTPLR